MPRGDGQLQGRRAELQWSSMAGHSVTTANESKLGGARGGHRGPIVHRVAAARVLPLLPVAARGARLVLSMGLAAGCVRARSSLSPLRGGHCPPLAASTSLCLSAAATRFPTASRGYGSQGGRRGVTPASTRLRPKAMCDSGRVRGTTMCVSTPLCEKQ